MYVHSRACVVQRRMGIVLEGVCKGIHRDIPISTSFPTYLSANLTAFLELQQQPHSAMGVNTAEGSYMNGIISGTNSPFESSMYR